MKYKEKRMSRNSDLRKSKEKEGRRKESEYVNKETRQDFINKGEEEGRVLLKGEKFGKGKM